MRLVKPVANNGIRVNNLARFNKHIRFNRYARYLLVVLVSFFLANCSMLQPKIEQPTVKVVGLQLLPAQGFTQPIQVNLLIANPNDRDLTLKGIAYTVGIENIDVLSGVSNQLPPLQAYQETPVTVVVSANVVQLFKLFEHFNRNGVKDVLNYNFSAKLDFSTWLPSLRVNEKGTFSLNGNNRINNNP